MTAILQKEYKLFVLPLVYIFMAFILMLLIPNYPYTVSFFYTCLGIFFCFQMGRENRDVYYMLMLPIKKKDIVKARYLTILSIEIIQILLCIPVSIIRGTVLTYPNMAGIDPDVAFYGGACIIFATFNLVFFSGYFKDVSKVGISFLKASIAAFLMVGLVEASVHIGKAVLGTCFWDSMKIENLIKQIPILLVGIVIFILVNLLGYRRDVKNFERQDF